MKEFTLPRPSLAAEREHRREYAVAAEMNRLVLEAITSAGGRVTPEGLVIIPGRPAWPYDVKLKLRFVNPGRVHTSYMLAIGDAAVRAKAMLFIDQFDPREWQCDDRDTAVLVLLEENR